MLLTPEFISIARTGAIMPGFVDPAQRKLYLGSGADVQAGDIAGIRDYTRRIIAMPEVWDAAGVVAEFEDAATYLPDLGQLLRGAGLGELDEDTGDRVPASTTTVWTDACKVEPAQSDGSNPELGDQQVGVVPFVVTVPLARTDIRPGDLFRVTQSRDGRLLARTLVVKAIRASSSELTRDVLAFDNQGG